MIKINFNEVCSKGKCDVCGHQGDVVVVASSLGPVSYAYCESCIMNGYEPYSDIVAFFAMRNDKENALDFYNLNEPAMKSFYKKTKDEFIKDFDKAVKDYNDWIEKEAAKMSDEEMCSILLGSN